MSYKYVIKVRDLVNDTDQEIATNELALSIWISQKVKESDGLVFEDLTHTN